MNKKRKFGRAQEDVSLCPNIAVGNPCEYGNTCKRSHDLDTYLAHRQQTDFEQPTDLNGTLEPSLETDTGEGSDPLLQPMDAKSYYSQPCILFNLLGKCPYGVRCHFFRAHMDENNQLVVREPWTAITEHQRNVLGREAQLALRKRNYDFTRSKEVHKELEKLLAMSREQPQQQPQSNSETGGDITPFPKESAAESVEKVEAAVEPVSCEGGAIIIDSPQEAKFKKTIDWRGKSYLAPLTTVGNLPFRRLCKTMGVDITCGEMAMSECILQAAPSEMALIRRHPSEDVFGVQVCGKTAEQMIRCTEVLNREFDVDFIDLNVGCPIDMVFNRGCGSGLMARSRRLEAVVRGMTMVSDVPITVKIRTGIEKNKNVAHQYIPKLKEWGAALCTLHGRSRQQRYTKLADWEYVDQCGKLAREIDLPFFGNGDVLSYEEYHANLENYAIDGAMIGRGALIKPWIFTEIKERRHWDISATERFDLMKQFVHFGLEHWGSDAQGVSKTRRYLLDWHSFHYRYIPTGLLEVLPQKMNERPPRYRGRNELETLMASDNVDDWIKLSSMIMGKPPQDFVFTPKHKSNSYESG